MVINKTKLFPIIDNGEDNIDMETETNGLSTEDVVIIVLICIYILMFSCVCLCYCVIRQNEVFQCRYIFCRENTKNTSHTISTANSTSITNEKIPPKYKSSHKGEIDSTRKHSLSSKPKLKTIYENSQDK